MSRAVPAAAGAAALALAVSLAAAPAQAANVPSFDVDVVAEGIAPMSKAVDVAPDGSALVGDSTGAVTRHVLHGKGAGTSAVVAQLDVPIIDLAVARNRAWILTDGGDVWTWRAGKDAPVKVANMVEYQVGDPDPQDLEGVPDESNAFSIAIHKDGSALVADAAGNDIVKVTADGDVSTFARFPVEVVATDHLGEMPPGEELPPEMPAESVPTGISVAPNGDVYVGELKGFPFRPGSSRIWRIDRDADGVDCSLEAAAGDDCVTAETGYTGIADLDVHPNGSIAVLEYAADGVLAFEGGFETGEFPPAVLSVSRKGERVELAEGVFSQPGGIAFAKHGAVVMDGMMTGARVSYLH